MSGAGWALRRLGAMGPAEVWRRARTALRDRLAPPAWSRLAPEAAFGRLHEGTAAAALDRSRLGRLVHDPGQPGRYAPALGEAAGLARGEWTLFGHPVRLEDPPDWSRDPLSGRRWPDLPSVSLDYRRADVAGGAKFAWEAGRLTMLPALALAARVEGDETAARRALAWLEDFTARNPLGRGIHHTSGIEGAVRVLTTTWTLALLGEAADPARLAAPLGLLAQQALHCRDHLSLGSSANNHLIAEYAAMAVAGGAFPTLRGAGALARAGLDGLARETLRQVHTDGVPAEQAFGYLPFVWELLLLGFLAGEAAGHATPAGVRGRLAASLEFARAVRLPGGNWPRVGDEDDGRVLLASEGWSRLDLVGNALAAWLDAPALTGETALAQVLTGRATAAAEAPDGRRDFEAGGWTVWRERRVLLAFDHGPLGLGRLAAHGHADALSIALFRGPDPIVVDPGTFAYHEDLAARERCRGTPQHATIHFGGRSQSESLGPFLWGRRARVQPDADAWRCDWATGERHWRRVEFADGLLTLEDRVLGRDAEIVFPLHPDAHVELEGRLARVSVGSSAATFRTEGAAPWQAAPGDYAPRFSHRQPAIRLTARLTGSVCGTRIEVGPA